MLLEEIAQTGLMYSVSCFVSGHILQTIVQCHNWDVEMLTAMQSVGLTFPLSFSLCVCVCVCKFVVNCFVATISSHPIYILLPCDFAVPILRGKLCFSRPLNLGQTYFAVISRMWQKLCCVSVSLGFQRPCIFYHPS